MRKIFIRVLLVIGLLLVISFFTFKDLKKDIMSFIRSRQYVTAFQIGAYSSREDALQCQKQYTNSSIYQDEEIYRVIISILSDSNAVLNMQNFFNSQNIKYYLKKIQVNNDFYEKIEEYDQIVLFASFETYEIINRQILSDYESMNNEQKI